MLLSDLFLAVWRMEEYEAARASGFLYIVLTLLYLACACPVSHKSLSYFLSRALLSGVRGAARCPTGTYIPTYLHIYLWGGVQRP